MDVLERANELGKAVNGSAEYERLKNAHKLIEDNSADCAIVHVFLRMQNRLTELMLSGDPDSDELKQVVTRLDSIQRQIEGNNAVLEYYTALKEFHAMLVNMNKAVYSYVQIPLPNSSQRLDEAFYDVNTPLSELN